MVGPSRYETLDDTTVAGANRLLLPEGLRFVSSPPLAAALGRAGIQLCSLAVGVALALIAIAASAQPPDTPIPPPTPAQQPVPKSDEHRIVGKVLELDRESGRVKLVTEEGVVILEVSEHVARAFRVGDTVSVPRSSSKPPSASPRQ
jgi:hypothetical protein